MSVESLPPAVARVLARREQAAEDERQAKALDQRWPMSVDVRGVVVNLALEMSGLAVNAEGTVTPTVPTEENPRPKPRTRLAAMRILATCDKLALEQSKIDLVENPSSGDDDTITPGDVLHSLKMTSKVGDQVMELILKEAPWPLPPRGSPPGPGHEPIFLRRKSRDRWPITSAMRCAVIESALGLCGYSITGEGKLALIPVTEETPKSKPRILLGAMRILTRFDRLSIMEQKLRQRINRFRSKGRPRSRANEAPGVTWEMLGRICEMVEEDERRRARAG
jgi:hypothetical protein